MGGARTDAAGVAQSVLVVLNSSGVPVDTFGSGGSISVPSGTAVLDNPGTTAFIDQGSLYTVTLNVGSGSTPSTVAVIRYTSSGVVDTTFGTSGSVVTNVPGWEGLVSFALASVQTDSKFVLAIQTSAGGISVARFNSDGTLDTSFGTDGLATLAPTGSTAGPSIANVVTVRPDGVILVAGPNVAGTAIVVGAFNADGSTDTAYGDGGATSLAVSGQAVTFVWSLLVRPDGEAIALCQQNGGVHSFAYLTPTGVADTNYGTGGVVSFAENGDEPITATLTPAGDIITVGQTNYSVMIVERYRVSDGSLDTSFGTDGQTTFSNVIAGVLGVITMEPDGTFLIGTLAPISGTYHLELMRLTAGGLVDTTFGTDGVSVGSATSVSPVDLFVDGDGRAMVMGYANDASLFLQRFNTRLGPERLYAEQDANYNVTSLTDAGGNVVERFVYSAYGMATVETAAGVATADVYQWAYTFQGGRKDAVTGLIHFGAREYNPTTGHWMQEDPADYINGPNRYELELGNPIILVDPSGLAGLPPNFIGPPGPGQTIVPTPPTNIPGGPWTWNPGMDNGRGGFNGPPQPSGPRGQLVYVPPEARTGNKDGYWKGTPPGCPEQRYNPNGEPISPEQAHPGNPPPADQPREKQNSPTQPNPPPPGGWHIWTPGEGWQLQDTLFYSAWTSMFPVNNPYALPLPAPGPIPAPGNR